MQYIPPPEDLGEVLLICSYVLRVRLTFESVFQYIKFHCVVPYLRDEKFLHLGVIPLQCLPVPPLIPEFLKCFTVCDKYIILVTLSGNEPFISVAGGRWYWKELIEEDPPRPFPLYWNKRQ